jgi:hypothetical protein
MKHSTIIENTYLPGEKKDGSEWSPYIGYTTENYEKFNNIKHVWGLKKMYSDYSIRNMILSVCKLSLDHYFSGWEMHNIELNDYLEKNLDTIFTQNITL